MCQSSSIVGMVAADNFLDVLPSTRQNEKPAHRRKGARRGARRIIPPFRIGPIKTALKCHDEVLSQFATWHADHARRSNQRGPAWLHQG